MQYKKTGFCKIFSKRFKAFRQQIGLSQTEFAEKFDLLHHTKISRIESGKTYPDIEDLAILSKNIDVDLHWLITGEISVNIKKVITLLKPYVYAHLQTLTKELERLESERRELESVPDQDAENQRLKEVNKAIEGLHYYYKTVLETLNEKLPKLTGDDPTV